MSKKSKQHDKQFKQNAVQYVIVLLFCTDRKRARLPYGSIISEPEAGRNGFILEFDSTVGCVPGRRLDQ